MNISIVMHMKNITESIIKTNDFFWNSVLTGKLH
jgi:hypothetical protein